MCYWGFSYAPERLNVQMLLDPLKEQFHLPSVFIKQRDISRTNPKVVSEISEGSFVFHGIIADSPEQDRIFFPRSRSRKTYHLIVENVIRVFKKSLAFNNFILKFAFFSYYEVGSNEIDRKELREIKISPVKDIIGVRFVRNLVHCVHVINSGLRNMKDGRYLGNHIIEGMNLDTTFGLTKARPPEKVKTQINSSRIKSIKPPTYLKFFDDSFSLCDRYHLVGKFLKDFVVPVRVRFREIATCYHGFTESQMVRLRGMSGDNADKFSETFTARELAIHHNQQLIPATERLNIFVTSVFHHYAIKNPFEKKFSELAENIFSIVHNTRLLKPDTICNFKSTR